MAIFAEVGRRSGNYSGRFSLKTQCTARCSRACDSAVGEHLIYNRKPANSRYREKNKNRKNPLRLMQNGSDEPLILWLAENPPSKLGNFQPVTASPYRVLHQAQGDKQKKQLFCWKYYGIFCIKIGKQHSVCSGKSGTILKRIGCSSCRKCFFCLSPWRGCQPSERRWG